MSLGVGIEMQRRKRMGTYAELVACTEHIGRCAIQPYICRWDHYRRWLDVREVDDQSGSVAYGSRFPAVERCVRAEGVSNRPKQESKVGERAIEPAADKLGNVPSRHFGGRLPREHYG